MSTIYTRDEISLREYKNGAKLELDPCASNVAVWNGAHRARLFLASGSGETDYPSRVDVSRNVGSGRGGPG